MPKDTHLYIGTCLLILAVSSAMTWFGKLPADSFVELIKWSFAALCTGGGLASFRNLRVGNGGCNGGSTVSKPPAA